MILAVVQARMGSSRLPGKVMLPVLGEPMLFRQIERVRRCKAFDALVIATSDDASDDALVEACKTRGVNVARGSVNDVLDRFMTAAVAYNPDVIVRLTGDCPLADPAVIDAVIAFYNGGSFDYVSNVSPPTFPDGLDVEVVSAKALRQAHENAKLPSEREHVTPYVRNHPELFRHGNYAGAQDLSQLRWTVDEPRDLEFVRGVYAALYPKNPAFGLSDILALVREREGLAAINTGIERNEGMKKSLEADAQLLKDKN